MTIPIYRAAAHGGEDDAVPKRRPDDKGAAPRFAMASPSIWCRITLRPPFSLLLSVSLVLLLHPPPSPPPVPTLATGMMLFLIKTNPGTTDLVALLPPSPGPAGSKGALDNPIFVRVHVELAPSDSPK